eukprot:TRINITY_DN6354_c0_g1_i1.p1 TRINITY_DN6354_c0_g1~~TRINITY_DN6354_c0_g1_i1.p1  ORF type:complete len:351 (+),score=124.37 TRINITY_DN6354_c0_g1_i1:46-1053(+)
MPFDYSKWDRIAESSDSDDGDVVANDLELAKLKAAIDDLKGVVERGVPSPEEVQAEMESSECLAAAAVAAKAGAAPRPSTDQTAPSSTDQTAPVHVDPAPGAGVMGVEAMQDDPGGAFSAGDVGVGTFRDESCDEMAIRWRSGHTTVTSWPNELWYRRASPAPAAADPAALAEQIAATLTAEGPLTTAEIFGRFRHLIGDGDGKVDKETFRAALHSGGCFRRHMKLWEAQDMPGRRQAAEDVQPEATRPSVAEPPETIDVLRPAKKKSTGLDYSRWDRIDADDDDAAAEAARLKQLQELAAVRDGLAAIQERRRERQRREEEMNRRYGFEDVSDP